MSLQAVLSTIDRRFVAHAVAWGLLSFAALGLVTAILPNPVFGRQIPPEPFAIWVWLLSAPLIGVVMATYTAPPPATALPLAMAGPDDLEREQRRTGALGTIAGLGAFLAIGCPVCNKVALVLLGWSGAMTVYAPIQPLIGAASLVLLVATLAWRLRSRARGGACEVRTA
jgi:hypothetical protein